MPEACASGTGRADSASFGLGTESITAKELKEEAV